VTNFSSLTILRDSNVTASPLSLESAVFSLLPLTSVDQRATVQKYFNANLLSRAYSVPPQRRPAIRLLHAEMVSVRAALYCASQFDYQKLLRL
jgi:hypothetical protein